MKRLIGLALFAILAFFAFQAASGIWGFASSVIFPKAEAAPEEKIFVSSITINSMAPESVLKLSDDADAKETPASPQISERKQKIIDLENRVQAYSSLFDSASLLEMDEYEAGSVN